MTNVKIFSYLFIISLIATTISCSSGNKSAEEGASPEVAEAATESVEAAPPADEFASQDATAPEAQPVPADEAIQTEAAQDMNAVDPNQPPTDTAMADPNLEASPAPEAAPTETAQTDTPPPAEEQPPAQLEQNAQNDLFGGAAATTDASAPAEEAPKKPLPITHIKDKPFKKGGQLLNTVYIAREGDTLEGISDKLFGENKTKELKKANPHLKKGVTTGAKVYFNSPNRPEDADRMMTVYEDQGLPPTTYATNEGDTLKSLAMEWYGTEASYKEIYAINRGLASPSELPAGTELQYWPASVSVIAYNTKKAEEPAAVVAEAPPVVEPPAPAQVEPTAPAPIAQNSPVPDAMAAGSINNTLPPPPPDLNAPALPPPPTAISKKKSNADAMDKDTVMYAVAAGVLLVGGGALVAIRRKNAKRNSGVTQI